MAAAQNSQISHASKRSRSKSPVTQHVAKRERAKSRSRSPKSRLRDSKDNDNGGDGDGDGEGDDDVKIIEKRSTDTKDVKSIEKRNEKHNGGTSILNIDGVCVAYSELSATDVKTILDNANHLAKWNGIANRFYQRMMQYIRDRVPVNVIVKFPLQADDDKVKWIRQTLKAVITKYNVRHGTIDLEIIDDDKSFQWIVLATKCECKWHLDDSNVSMGSQFDNLALKYDSNTDKVSFKHNSVDESLDWARFNIQQYCSYYENNPKCEFEYCYCKHNHLNDKRCCIGPCDCKAHNISTKYNIADVYSPMVFFTLDLSSTIKSD